MKKLLIHLRLHFQLLLAPVFLWGWLVAGGGLSPGLVLGFVSFHVFLYTGATAFNSYYDRDVGPVGGLERPPGVTPALLPFSLAVQAIGWALAAAVNLPFFLIYGAFVALALAYSHPRVRLKGRTLTSLGVVGLGQGALAFLGAWAAARSDLSSVIGADGVLGVMAAVLLILALYPLTQLYQIEEDAARGDRTIAVVWGPAWCFAFATACTLTGGSAMIALLASRFGALDALLLGSGLLAQVVAVGWLAYHFAAREVVATYRRVTRLNVVSASALGAYFAARLLLGSR